MPRECRPPAAMRPTRPPRAVGDARCPTTASAAHALTDPGTPRHRTSVRQPRSRLRAGRDAEGAVAATRTRLRPASSASRPWAMNSGNPVRIEAISEKPPVPRRPAPAAQLLVAELRESPRVLCGPDDLHELRPVAEFVLSSGR